MADAVDSRFDRMDVTITTVAQRPELTSSVWAMPDSWPQFMDHDPIADALFPTVAPAFRDLSVVATDAAGTIVAHGTAIAFRLDIDGRRELPVGGWDQSLIWAHSDLYREVEPDVASALEVSVHRDWQGQGLSSRMIAAMREAAREKGFSNLLAPVRPTGVEAETGISMAEYATLTRLDGLPVDPWLRVHVRLGGVIEMVAPISQTISGSLAQWRSWTGLPFDSDGPTHVPGTLGPVHVHLDDDYAVYVESNVWVRHTV